VRIAQIAPLFEAIPPKLYGGTERVVSWLTEELVAQGHEVTLFASGDSVTKATLEPVWPMAIRLDPMCKDWVAAYHVMMEYVAQRAREFDVLHFHTDYFPFSLFRRLGAPFLTTLHGRLDLPEFKKIYGMFPNVPLVSISDAQRLPLEDQNWIGTVLHGLPADLLIPRPVEQRYLAFLGRISPEKGPDRAIKIAKRMGMKLKIAAKVDSADRKYFDEEIKHLFEDADVEFVGEINDRQKPDFLSGAHALLFPIDWPEPFGLVMIESMACGTPVIAYGHGSVPEVMEDGVTGFIVDNEDEAVEAVRRLAELDRAGVRAAFEARFTSARMARDYVALYTRVARKLELVQAEAAD